MKTKADRPQIIFFVLLFVICMLPALIYGSQQGFYWDDWSQMFLAEKYGTQTFWDYFAYDRPGSAWTHILFFPICGTDTVRWHLLICLLRFAAVSLSVVFLRKLFPDASRTILLTGFLLAVCPLFSQQHISIAYSQHYTDWVLFALSFAAELKLLDSDSTPRRLFWGLIWVVSTLDHLSVTEYFACLEALKIAAIWFYGKEKTGPARKAWLTAASLLVFGGYLYVRLNIKTWDPVFSGNTPELIALLKSDFPAALKQLFGNIYSDLYYLLFGFWSRIFSVDALKIKSLGNLRAGLLALIFASACCLFFRRQDLSDERSGKWYIPAFGVLWVMLGIAPFWIMNECYSMTNDFPHADRCFFAAMTGFCLCIAYVIDRLSDQTRGFAAAAAVIVFLFGYAFLRFQQDAVYEWERQKSVFEQIAVRVPGLKRNTSFIAETILFPEQGNFASASALNLIYADEGLAADAELPVWVFGTRGTQYSPEGAWHTVSKRNYRFTSGEYIYIVPENKFGNCVWFPTADDADRNPYLSENDISWAMHSYSDNIDTDVPSSVPTGIFGKQENNWCKTYQTASLLAQKGDWQVLAELADDTLEAGFSPSDTRSNSPYEWVPFIRAYRNTGEDDKAEQLIAACLAVDPKYTDFFAGL